MILISRIVLVSRVSTDFLSRVLAARFGCASALTVGGLNAEYQESPSVTSGKAPVDTVQLTQKTS